METRHISTEITISRPGIAPYLLPLDIVTYPARHPEAGRDVLREVAPSAILPSDWSDIAGVGTWLDTPRMYDSRRSLYRNVRGED